MGIIHQKLYQKENLAGIEMKDYFQNLSESVLDTFNAIGRIKILLPMQPLDLDVDTAVPVGLITNELLTNAIKYAFAENETGEIQISLTETRIENGLVFRLSDNGIGKQNNTSPKGTGFGTELVNLLVQQLEGNLTVVINNGTTIEIEFKHRKPH
jgi:two-component sensor histidine kinase